MLNPGPDHPITVQRSPQRWRAYFHGRVIADSANAVVLNEANLPQVVYFPREDVAMEYFGRTDRATHCPYKGQAGYYTLRMDGEVAENVAWTYDQPGPGVPGIAGHIAFYTDRVEVHPVDDAVVNPHHHLDPSARHRDPNTADLDVDVDEVVKHTDSGSGASQRDHWQANTAGPDGGVR